MLLDELLKETRNTDCPPTPITDKYYVYRPEGGFEEVEGRPVKIEGYPGEAFIHRPMEMGNDGIQKAGWVVSDARNGRQIGAGKTQKLAIIDSEMKVNYIGTEKTRAVLEDWDAKGCVTPRYKSTTTIELRERTSEP